MQLSRVISLGRSQLCFFALKMDIANLRTTFEDAVEHSIYFTVYDIFNFILIQLLNARGYFKLHIYMQHLFIIFPERINKI